jgi:hypothetical protein
VDRGDVGDLVEAQEQRDGLVGWLVAVVFVGGVADLFEQPDDQG